MAQQQESEDHEGSVQGISSDEAVGEQQLGTFELYPPVLQPSGDGAERGADVSIVRSLDELPAEESAHLANKGKRVRVGGQVGGGRQPGAAASGASCPIGSADFRLHVGSLKEGTMTVEVGRTYSRSDAAHQWFGSQLASDSRRLVWQQDIRHPSACYFAGLCCHVHGLQA